MLRPHPFTAAGAAVSRIARTIATLLAVFGMVAVAAGPAAGLAMAAEGDGPVMEARVLLEGHARLGAWLAVEVRLRNDGPPVVGELRLQAGTQGGTRFSTPVDLPSPSDKIFVLHAQPPSFGQSVEVQLVVGDEVISRQPVQFTVHDATKLTIGVVAAEPQGIVGGIDLPANQNNVAPAIIPLDPSDLPDRLEGWAAIDRLVWQDVDTNTLSQDQIEAMRGWLALGGRLVIVGGTAGPAVLSGFPDAILPYRPATTVEVAPESLVVMLGAGPEDAAPDYATTDVPALTGELARGRALATSGDAVIAADLAYGSGSVTLIGFDPTVGWIADSNGDVSLWRAVLPARTVGIGSAGDDSQIVTAVSELPALSLPPIEGLLLLLVGYIALIGPVNYLVLRRLDRREWAWITMPALIAIFAVGAYGFGSALRGSDIIVNEVAVVRGAPDTTEGSAQVYLGVFSPTRGTYQLAVAGGALLSAPVVGDFFAGQGALLDVVQGETSRVRDLSVGFGSLRTVRAESAVTSPKVHAELQLIDGILRGTIRNDSEKVLESPAIVLGGNTAVLKDIPPGQSVEVNLRIVANQFGLSLGDRIFGQIFMEQAGNNETVRRNSTRHRILSQLTYDPMRGNTGELPSDVPVLLAWGRDALLDVTVEGQEPARVANVLYYIPMPMSISGQVAFRSDLIRSTVVESDAAFFTKDAYNMGFGQGSVTIAYRPIPFEGNFEATEVILSAGWETRGGPGKPVEPEPLPAESAPPGASDGSEPGSEPAIDPVPPEGWDGMAEIDVFDREAGGWRRLPHMTPGEIYNLTDPGRYVDPATATLQIRFSNDHQESVNFGFNVTIAGTVR